MTHRGVPCRSRTRGGPDDCAGQLPLQARWHEPHAGVVSDKPGVTDRVHIPWARLLIIAGAATMVISAAVGYAWLKRMPELQPVDFGQHAQIRATESTSATIFASTGLSQAPSCAVTSGGGDPVTVGNAQRYHQAEGLESAFSFPVTAGTRYTVTCSGASEDGRFAVARDPAVPEGIFIAAGSLGLVMCVVGGLLAFRQRQRRSPPRSSAPASSPHQRPTTPHE